MYNIYDIRDIHFEITNKCQARCPMCPRRIQGGPLNPLLDLREIDLDTFKQWFEPEFIQQLWNFYMCGNLGDPIIARDTLEIFRYIRQHNPAITLSMHTNGSARNSEWWAALADLDVRVVFGIDGLSDTHHLYRISTDWDTIITNASAFIEAGGIAEWHMLVFEHNQHQIQACEQLSQRLGFKTFRMKHTARFTGDSFDVLDDNRNITHVLKPAQRKQNEIPRLPVIDCKSVQYKQIYVSAMGNISPCCWLDMQHKDPVQDRKIDYMDKISMTPNLYNQSLEEIFDSGYFDKIKKTWSGSPLKECSRQCGAIDKLKSQFN